MNKLIIIVSCLLLSACPAGRSHYHVRSTRTSSNSMGNSYRVSGYYHNTGIGKVSKETRIKIMNDIRKSEIERCKNPFARRSYDDCEGVITPTKFEYLKNKLEEAKIKCTNGEWFPSSYECRDVVLTEEEIEESKRKWLEIRKQERRRDCLEGIKHPNSPTCNIEGLTNEEKKEAIQKGILRMSQ